MKDLLRRAELFEGLDESEVSRLEEIAVARSLNAGEYLFFLGEEADRLYVVSRGKIDLCFPMSFGGAIRDVTLETLSAGHTLGWSSLVKPYRFTLSARVAESTEVFGFWRADLLRSFDVAPRIGYIFSRRLSEIIGHRLLNLQALWARELQRAVDSHLTPTSAPPPPAAPAG